ncbi:hypothetical protein [Caballeronia sp. INML1]|uniref:hypothetical protein n=1 Tax=Caballeronia sp. INML1 TaxID=2921760 RepID=UPI0020287AC1|nr:hypothetical protein [Caballeronia sp. INML1]
MSTFARIAANRLRDMSLPLTEQERLSYAHLLDMLSTDVGRCYTCLQHMAQMIDARFEAGADLTIELPRELHRIITGEQR